MSNEERGGKETLNKSYSGVLHIGFGNYVNKAKVLAISGNPHSAPNKRAVYGAEDEGKLITQTEGKRIRSLIHLDGGFIVLSSVDAKTLGKRWGED